MEKSNKESTLNTRIDLDLKKQLKILANKENRTLSNYVVLNLKKLVEDNKNK